MRPPEFQPDLRLFLFAFDFTSVYMFANTYSLLASTYLLTFRMFCFSFFLWISGNVAYTDP